MGILSNGTLRAEAPPAPGGHEYELGARYSLSRWLPAESLLTYAGGCHDLFVSSRRRR